MIRGTTPTFKLMLNDETVDLTQAVNVYATFKQKNKEITKTGADLEISAHEVDVYLSQEETLSFISNNIVSIQLNWTYANGRRACSQVINMTIGENLLPEVLE